MKPGFVVLDKVCEPGSGPNEDRVGYASCVAWAIDGSSTLEPVKGALSSDPVATRSLVDRVDQCLQRNDPAWHRRGAVAILNDVLRTVVPGEGRRGVQVPSCAIGIVTLGEEWIECAILGDITIVVQGEGFTHVLTDQRIEPFEQESIQALQGALGRGCSYEQAWQVVQPVLRRHRQELRNRPGGYWLIADDPEAGRYAVVERIPVEGIRRLLLATDGFARVVRPFGVTPSWEDLVKGSAASSGLAHIVERLRNLEASDPECRTYPRLKVSDDVGALLLERMTRGS